MNNLEMLDNIVNQSNKSNTDTIGNWEKLVTGKGILNPEQESKFLRDFQIVDPSATLARLVWMKSPTRETSKYSIKGRVLQDGYVKGTHTTNKNLTKAEQNWDPQEIITHKYKAKIVLTDDDMEENIERQNIQETVLSEMGYRIGLDNIYLNWFGDTSITDTNDKLLYTRDGWIKQAGTTIKSKGLHASQGKFDLDEGVTTLFDALRQALPAQYRSSNQQLAIFAPYEVEDAYRNYLGRRWTSLGDTQLQGWDGLKYKNMPVIHCPTLDDDYAQGLDGTAPVVLANPANLESNMFQDITCELARDAEGEENKFIFRFKGTPSIQRKDGVVVAKISLDELAEIQEHNKNPILKVQQVNTEVETADGG